MVLLTIYVAVTSHPPVGEAVTKTFVPDHIDLMSIVTLVGGSVGGYITFAGGHRLGSLGRGAAELAQQTAAAVHDAGGHVGAAQVDSDVIHNVPSVESGRTA